MVFFSDNVVPTDQDPYLVVPNRNPGKSFTGARIYYSFIQL